MKRIKHIVVKRLATGYYKLTPKQGYLITDGHNTFTSAVDSTTAEWSAIKI